MHKQGKPITNHGDNKSMRSVIITVINLKSDDVTLPKLISVRIPSRDTVFGFRCDRFSRVCLTGGNARCCLRCNEFWFIYRKKKKGYFTIAVGITVRSH